VGTGRMADPFCTWEPDGLIHVLHYSRTG
jgi:hypothetical protein